MYVVYKRDLFGSRVPVFVSQQPADSLLFLMTASYSAERVNYKGQYKTLLHI